MLDPGKLFCFKIVGCGVKRTLDHVGKSRKSKNIAIVFNQHRQTPCLFVKRIRRNALDYIKGSRGCSPPVLKVRGQGLKGDPEVGLVEGYRKCPCSHQSLGPAGLKCVQYRQTLHPCVERIRRTALLLFGTQQRISRTQPSSTEGSRR